MTHVHEHGGSTTVISDGDGPATALVVLIGMIIVGVLIWFFAFSGVVFNRGGGDTNVRIDQNPPAQNNNNTNTNPGQQPAPAQS